MKGAIASVEIFAERSEEGVDRLSLVIGSLERIAAQVEKSRHPQSRVRPNPHFEAVRLLDTEQHFPIAVAERGERAVVGEVEELLSRSR